MSTKLIRPKSELPKQLVLPADTSVAVLKKIEVKQFPSYNDPNEKEDKVLLRFGIECPKGTAWCTAFLYPSHGPNSRYMKLLRAMGAPAEAQDDEDEAWEFLLAQEGKEFLVQHEPDKDGKWNNFVNAMKVPSLAGKMPAPQAPKKEEPKPEQKAIDFADDPEIPF